MRYHEAFADLRDAYLEDSWVIRISETPGTVAFDLEAVLTPTHGRYTPSKPGEQYC